jgi:transposase
MDNATTYVGLDAHQDHIAMAMLRGQGREWTELRFGGDRRGLEKLVRRLSEETVKGAVVSAYEAGPLGYALQRRLESAGICCQVVAPSLIAVKPGDRIKTDRRYARRAKGKRRCATSVGVARRRGRT